MYIHNTSLGTHRYVILLIIIISNMIIIGRYNTYIVDKPYNIHEYLHDIIKYHTRVHGIRRARSVTVMVLYRYDPQ